jgi:hypothetical protein
MKITIDGCKGTELFESKNKKKFYEAGDQFTFDKGKLKLLKWMMNLAGAEFTYETYEKPRKKSSRLWLAPPKSRAILVTIIALPLEHPKLYLDWMTVMMMNPDNFRTPKPLSKARQRIDLIRFADLQEKCFAAASQNGSMTDRYYEDH